MLCDERRTDMCIGVVYVLRCKIKDPNHAGISRGIPGNLLLENVFGVPCESAGEYSPVTWLALLCSAGTASRRGSRVRCSLGQGTARCYGLGFHVACPIGSQDGNHLFCSFFFRLRVSKNWPGKACPLSQLSYQGRRPHFDLVKPGSYA